MSQKLAAEIREILNRGVVIPAHPLALNGKRQLDEQRQRALSRYYLDAGAGGLAVGVHTTQFEIRRSEIGLYKPVLKLAEEEMDDYVSRSGRPVARIAGVIGQTSQAVQEAEIASEFGYDAVLLSLSAFPDASNETLIKHCREVSKVMPLFGFYIQPAVGGRDLDVDFWRAFAQIDNVVALKVAPFSRYQTIDVVRGLVESGRSDEIALYTGNDDSILVDLLSEYEFMQGGESVKKRFVGGLLGHWAVWTRSAVQVLEDVHKRAFDKNTEEALSLAHQITDCNAAFFDAANQFAGCIGGLHEVLRRQGLLEGVWTLNENEVLSPRQLAEIDRVYNAYPELNDDSFVAENLDRWLR